MGAVVVTIFNIIGRRQSLSYFHLFIMLVIGLEIIIPWSFKLYFTSNYLILNYYSKICMYYYIYLFIKIFEDRYWTKWYTILLVLFIIVTQANYFIALPVKKIDAISYNIGMVILFPLILKYLFERIYTDVYCDIFRDPHIYLAFGILLFYTSAFPILTFINVLITNNEAYKAYVLLINFGNIFLSLAYLGVALCSKNPKLSTISS